MAVSFPYSTLNVAFTLDDTNLINVSTLLDDTYFTIKLEIDYYAFYSEELQSKELNYKIPLFNKQATFNAGRKIHRILENIKTLNSQEIQYRLATVKFSITELNYVDDTTVDAVYYPNILFAAGVKPYVNNNTALLDINNFAARVTPNAFKNISFLIPAGDRTRVILKNGNLVDETTEYIEGTYNVRTYRYNFSEFNPVPGDVFKVGIKNTTAFKSVFIFPEQNLSNTILFIDEFKLINSIECTGGFSTPTKYKQITHKYKRNFVEIIEVIETTKENSFLINTGWVLKTDNITIDSLLRSKKAWLFLSATEAIELVPVAEKLVNVDSENDLYQYNLEFKINRTSDAQNYTF